MLVDIGSTFSDVWTKFSGAVTASDGKIIFAPSYPEGVGVFEPLSCRASNAETNKIIGIIVGSLLGSCALLCFCYYYARRSRWDCTWVNHGLPRACRCMSAICENVNDCLLIPETPSCLKRVYWDERAAAEKAAKEKAAAEKAEAEKAAEERAAKEKAEAEKAAKEKAAKEKAAKEKAAKEKAAARKAAKEKAAAEEAAQHEEKWRIFLTRVESTSSEQQITFGEVPWPENIPNLFAVYNPEGCRESNEEIVKNRCIEVTKR